MSALATPRVAGLAWERDGRLTVLLANVGAEEREVALPPGTEQVHLLAPMPRGWEVAPADGGALWIGPYRAVRLRGHAGVGA